jgi:hypothetical protein
MNMSNAKLDELLFVYLSLKLIYMAWCRIWILEVKNIIIGDGYQI